MTAPMTPYDVAAIIANMTIRDRVLVWQALRDIEGDDPAAAGMREPLFPKAPTLTASASLKPPAPPLDASD